MTNSVLEQACWSSQAGVYAHALSLLCSKLGEACFYIFLPVAVHAKLSANSDDTEPAYARLSDNYTQNAIQNHERASSLLCPARSPEINTILDLLLTLDCEQLRDLHIVLQDQGWAETASRCEQSLAQTTAF